MKRHLSQEQYEKLGQLLSDAFRTKKTEHSSDLQSASVLIYNMVKSDYIFDVRDLRRAIIASGEKYSSSTMNLLTKAIEVCKYLVPGLENPDNKRFKLRRPRRNKYYGTW